jgi:hypothetical protein
MATKGIAPPPPPPPRIRYRIELFAGEQMVQSISVRGYRPTAAREADRICSAPGLWESWALNVSAWQLRRIRDERVFDRTEVRVPDPATHIESKELKQ